MKITHLLVIFALSTLVGCGADAGRPARRPPKSEVVRPPMSPENSVIPAHIHRDRGYKVMSSLASIPYLLTNPSSLNYRSIPDITTDDEGSSRNVRTLEEAKTRPKNSCGLGIGLTLTQRRADCANKNNLLRNFIWEAVNGAAGEADWLLVSLNNDRHEIWLDTRTGMVWSDVVSSGTNWCNAAQVSDGACADLKAANICKSGLGGVDSIAWRLPTRNEFLQADLDGMRFVLKSKDNDDGFWTATLDAASVSRDKAWVYEANQGTLKSSTFSNNKTVRCIGVANL